MIDMPEAHAFIATLDNIDPGQLTKCPEWTARELTTHIVAGAVEIERNVTAFNNGGPEAVPETRSLEEREAPYHQMGFDELRSAVSYNHGTMLAAITEALERDSGAVTPWAGRQMPISAFVTHARSEYALHRWDLVGDDEISMQLLAQPELTAHAVHALGAVLTQRGTASGATGEFVLASPGQPDVIVGNDGVGFSDAALDSTVTGDPAARLLLLWGRTADQPGRLQSLAAATDVAALRALLAGY